MNKLLHKHHTYTMADEQMKQLVLLRSKRNNINDIKPCSFFMTWVYLPIMHAGTVARPWSIVTCELQRRPGDRNKNVRTHHDENENNKYWNRKICNFHFGHMKDVQPNYTRPLFTKKTPSHWYRYPHYKPKTVWRPSQVYNGNPYTSKEASSSRTEALHITSQYLCDPLQWYP